MIEVPLLLQLLTPIRTWLSPREKEALPPSRVSGESIPGLVLVYVLTFTSLLAYAKRTKMVDLSIPSMGTGFARNHLAFYLPLLFSEVKDSL